MRGKNLVNVLVAGLFFGWAASGLAQVWTAANALSANWISVACSAEDQSLMTVTVNGQGKVSPNYDGKTVNNGGKYVMTASHGKGYIFAGWSGDMQSGAPKLCFTVTHQLSVQANFIPNPFLAVSGKYYGATSPTNSVGGVPIAPFRGTLIAHVLGSGAYVATLQDGRQKYHFSGKFSADGTAVHFIVRKGSPPISVQLQLDLSGGNVLNATITELTISTEISADRIF